MNVFLIGANGQVGKHIVRILKESKEHTLKAMVRSEEQAASLKEDGVTAVVANLEGSVDELATAMEGSDAVVFSAGSGGKTGPDKTLLVDLDGAVKSMEAAQKAGIERYVMVSAHQAHNRDSWKDSPIKPYMVAKHYADKILVESGLNYTIVRPGGLENDPGTGKVKASENLERGNIPREDVARTVVTSLAEENAYRRSFDLIAGELEIADALKQI
ncbi:SDR family oxidoreductase [Oceanobacillus piezotolerans]|uniref:SDR family oxidoreductase n=1 Tax=Oceanobacillus piezotolerans TaxID=2448030 RepID=A0A498DB82_9BACI|nr:SDR family oxidoreductase [Oceanobacillus piezotolerans]RLL42737.1 SDR family oxidoreductase [Oceanobacillus piezotolerans]